MDEDMYETVEAYLNNTLSETERKEFEKRLAADTDFRDEVKPLLANELALQQAADQEKRKRFDEWYAEAKEEGITPPTQVRPIRPLWIAVGIAAAIAVLLLVFWPRPKAINAQELYAANFQPYYPPEVRGGTDLDSLTKAAHVFILQEDYDQAIPLMEEIISDDESALKERLYLASAYLETDQAQKALDLLKPISFEESAEAAWYQAMAHLALGNWEEAKPLLERLATKEDSFYGKKAREVLKE